MKRLLYLLLFILSLEIASAAILHGVIYDTKLNKLNDVVVEVNSTSPQMFVSKEGQYSFVLDPGVYKITAKYKVTGFNYLYTEQNLTISKDTIIKNDLLLKPARKVEMPAGAVTGVGGQINYSLIISVAAVLLLISLGFTIYKLRSSNIPGEKQEFDSHTNNLLKVIREDGGRTTQKDIRKNIPLSEAKISLMITELENKGILKRIKKGRGNVIILQKK